ncbi:hypothetical protein WJX79_007276 [Trebouxia sp. C0005]
MWFTALAWLVAVVAAASAWSYSREAVYGAEESLAVRSGLSKTQVALKASTKRHQQVSLERNQLQTQLQQEKQKTAAEQNKSQRLAKSLNDKGVEAQRLQKELVQANRHVFSRESFESDIAILTSKVAASEAGRRQLQQQLTSEASLEDLKVLKEKLAIAENEAASAKAALDVSAGQETVSMVLNLQQPACDDATCSREVQEHVTSLEAGAKELQAQLDTAHQQVQAAQQQRTEVQAKLDRKLSDQDEEAQQLRQKLSDKGEEAQQLQEKLSMKEDEAQQVSKNRDNWEARVDAREAKLEQTRGMLIVAQQSCSDSKEQLSSERLALKQLQQQYSEACSSRQDMELKLEELQRQLDAKAHEAHALQQSLLKAQSELKDQGVLLQDHQALTQQAEVERQELQQEVTRLEGELATALATSAAAGLCEDLQKEIVECKDELVAMQQDLTEWPHAWGSFQPKTGQVKAAMAAVNDRLKIEVIEAQSELETKLAEVQAEAAKSAAEAKAQRQNAHITDRERRQEDLKEMVSDRKEAEERAARLQQQLQQKKMEVKQLKADMQEAIHARDALKEEMQRKLGQIATLGRDLAEAKNESTALQKQLQVAPCYPNSNPLGSRGSSDELGSIEAAPADVDEADDAELHNVARTMSEHDPEVQHMPGILDEGSSDVRMGASAESSPEHAVGVQTPWQGT